MNNHDKFLLRSALLRLDDQRNLFGSSLIMKSVDFGPLQIRRTIANHCKKFPLALFCPSAYNDDRNMICGGKSFSRTLKFSSLNQSKILSQKTAYSGIFGRGWLQYSLFRFTAKAQRLNCPQICLPNSFNLRSL